MNLKRQIQGETCHPPLDYLVHNGDQLFLDSNKKSMTAEMGLIIILRSHYQDLHLVQCKSSILQVVGQPQANVPMSTIEHESLTSKTP